MAEPIYMTMARRYSANSLTTLRLALTPLFLLLIQSGNHYALPVYLVACATDLFDGKVARALHTDTFLGSVFDASTDFLLIVIGFGFYASSGLVGWWFLAVIAASFTQYVVTMRVRVSDRLGKHMGTILFVLLALLILFPTGQNGTNVSIFGTIYIMSACALRGVSLLKFWF